MLHYPFEFYLDDGTSVIVNTTNTIVYQFFVVSPVKGSYSFDWHVFKGKEGIEDDQLMILNEYINILDEHRVVALN
jgi:hypothetical protein